ncbi:MAG: hypothetical protein JWQ25_2375 [Daejeonella sp.]|nr:hypothetical protein [Daejeonella sp.]
MKHIATILASFALILIVNWTAAQERIYLNSELFERAQRSFDLKKFRDAEVYIFALIQRNTEQYKSDKKLRDVLNEGLNRAREKKSLPGSSGQTDDPGFFYYPKQMLADGASASVNFKSGTYTNSTGQKYQINRIGNEIWWLSYFSYNKVYSVMKGKIIGNQIFGDWSFIPSVGKNSSGTLKLLIVNSNTFRVEAATGPIQHIGNMIDGTNWSKE